MQRSPLESYIGKKRMNKQIACWNELYRGYPEDGDKEMFKKY